MLPYHTSTHFHNLAFTRSIHFEQLGGQREGEKRDRERM
jgi:hypothetical protein